MQSILCDSFCSRTSADTSEHLVSLLSLTSVFLKDSGNAPFNKLSKLAMKSAMGSRSQHCTVQHKSDVEHGI